MSENAAVRWGGLCLKTLSAETDPLNSLSARDYARLATQARAQLATRVPAATRRLLQRGRCDQLVVRRMRWLLDQGGR